MSEPRTSQSSTPDVFPAFEDTAAYVTATLSRAKAITLARDECWALRDDFSRDELHAVRVYMLTVEGESAAEFFNGEFDRGWIEVTQRPLNAKQRANLIPMWKVEPR